MANPVFPDHLKKIGVFAPSSYVEHDDIERGVATMRAYGIDVDVHPQTFLRHHQSAGTPAEKVDALHTLYRDPSIDIIWAAGGGNRAMHILDTIDIDLIRAHPKPIIGFSDVTALLNDITARAGLVNIHGPVFKNISKYQKQDMDALASMLSGDEVGMPLNEARTIHGGRAEGRLLGGNLSVFQYMPQTMAADALDGAILFLEDCNEEVNRIDRMLLHLKRSGVFDHISGLVMGEFLNLQDSTRPFGFSLGDLVREHLGGRDIPIVMDAPFGHGERLSPLPVGGQALLDTLSPQPILISQIG